MKPVPNPMAVDYCAVQHYDTIDGEGVTVCDELYAEAPFVHVLEGSDTHVTAGLQGTSFVTADGTTYAYSPDAAMVDPESERHAVALYELTLDGDSVRSFRPVVVFNEALFVDQFRGRALEGMISRRVGEQFAEESTLPVRLEVSAEAGRETSLGYTLTARIANLDSGITAADESCMPALTSYGDEAPFAEGAAVEIEVSRSPWMHGAGDDAFVLDVIVDGASIGSMMAPQWYRGPIDLVRDTLEPDGTYDGSGHGSPGSIPELTLEAVDVGGEPCTP